MKARRSFALANCSILALTAILAACTAPTPGGSSAPTRNFTVTPPPVCIFKEIADIPSGRDCIFTTADGRRRVVRIEQWAAPFDEFFDRPEARTFLRDDPEGFWALAVTDWEALAASIIEPGATVRRAEARAFAPPVGAEACVWFVSDQTSVEDNVAGDIQGIRCALYDPATDVVEDFKLEYMEIRPSGTPPAPGFAADAERVVRTLRSAPPAG